MSLLRAPAGLNSADHGDILQTHATDPQARAGTSALGQMYDPRQTRSRCSGFAIDCQGRDSDLPVKRYERGRQSVIGQAGEREMLYNQNFTQG